MVQRAIVLVLLAAYASATPIETYRWNRGHSFSLRSDEILDQFSTSTNDKSREPVKKPVIKYLNIKSDISNRYAKTLVSSKVSNVDNDLSREAHFSVILPEDAFITAFSMEIDGKKYNAYIKEKEEAKKEYNDAVGKHQTAAHIFQNARDSDRFTVSVNIAPQSKVIFSLHYEELLHREFGVYKHVINLNPGQIVPMIEVEVSIKELRNITGVRANELSDPNGIASSEGENPDAQVEIIDPQQTKIKFKMDEARQRELAKKNKEQVGFQEKIEGVNGQFSVEYDVQQDPSGGQIIVNDGYFVHYFAPKDLPALPKHVLFVLDTSGSMFGDKIKQLKEAMVSILDDLRPDDFFTIIEFSYSVTVRNLDAEVESAVFQPHFEAVNIKPTPFPATPHYIQKAKAIVDKMSAGGGTNIYDALKMALEIAKKEKPTNGTEEKKSVSKTHPMIVFLTDGEPTVGETNLRKIRTDVEEFNAVPQATIFSLSFGVGADFAFLKKVSLANNGFARKIYEAADAAMQLKDFYKQISSPLLSNIRFVYPQEQIEEVTKRNFANYFLGSELVIAGKIGRDANFTEVEAITSDGPHKFLIPIPKYPVDAAQPLGSLERHWAFLKLKQLLDEDEIQPQIRNESQKQPKDEALKLALKYSFVCPLTSLVVVKPDGETPSNPETAGPNPEHPAALRHTTRTAPKKLNHQGHTTQNGGRKITNTEFPTMHRTEKASRRVTEVFPTVHRTEKASRRVTEDSGTAPQFITMTRTNLMYQAPGFGYSGHSRKGAVYAAQSYPSSFATSNRIFGPASLGQPGPAPTDLQPQLTSDMDRVDYDAETESDFETTATADLEPNKENLSQIPWLAPLVQGNELAINTTNLNKTLLISTNQTSDIPQSCSARGTPGNCTTLGQCLDQAKVVQDLDDYVNYYYCPLQGNVAGYCCIQESQAETTSSATTEASTESLAKEPTVTESTPKEPTVTDSAPKEATVTDSAPKEPTVTESAPKEPTVTESAPKEPTVTESAPREATVTESAPKEPTITESAPKEPTATESAPREPTETDSDPKTAEIAATPEPIVTDAVENVTASIGTDGTAAETVTGASVTESAKQE